MLRRLSFPISATLLSLGLYLPSVRAGESAYIPAGVDPGSIRLEKVRLVNVRAVTYSAQPCEVAFRDPGGSSVCPQARDEAAVAAYEATYSYAGPPLASDQSAGGSFSFSVRFRPDELPPDTKRAMAFGKLSRSDAAAYFTLTTSHGLASRTAIDGRQSRLCPGRIADGQWTHTDPACHDEVVYRAVATPSDYLTVTVEPVAAHGPAAGLVSSR